MLRSSFVPGVFLAPRTVEQQPHGSPFPGLPSCQSARQATCDGFSKHHFHPVSQWFASRTVGFIDAIPILLPGTEVLWARCFVPRCDIGMDFMPTKWMSRSLSRFYQRTGLTAESQTCSGTIHPLQNWCSDMARLFYMTRQALPAAGGISSPAINDGAFSPQIW